MKLISILSLTFFAFNIFAQINSKKSIDQEKKQIEILEKELASKKDALKKFESNKEDELKRIETEKKSLIEKEEKLRSELNLKPAESPVEIKTPVATFTEQSTVQAQTSTHSREWLVDGISVVNFMLSNVFTPEGGSTKNRKGQGFYFEFGRNFGFTEISPIIYFSDYDYETYKTARLMYGLNAAFNFIENKPGNNLIPYAVLTISKDKSSEDWPTTSTKNDWTDDNTQLQIGGGLKYFPFGQIFSLKTELSFSSMNGKYDETNAGKFDYNKSGFNLALGSLIYF